MSTTTRISLSILLSITILAGCASVSDQSEHSESPDLLRYQSACEAGSAEACYQLGLAYQFGRYGVEVDRDRAFELHQMACRDDVGAGCNNLGTFYEHGYSTPRDDERAAELYQQSCELGEVFGCSNLGLARMIGRGVPQDYGAARTLFEYSCKREHARACSELGVLYREGLGVDVDEERAAELYGQGCELEDAESCTRLGWLFDAGRGVEQDLWQAAFLYRLACNNDCEIGCTNLGVFYEFGRGVEVDVEEAANLYTRGCDFGSPQACYRLGELYRLGNGVSEKFVLAVELYEEACEGGFSKGCRRMGEFYMGGPPDSEARQRALQYFANGCDGGDRMSCRLLARHADEPSWEAKLLSTCEVDASNCLPVAQGQVERGTEESVTMATQLLDIGCENDMLPSCMGRVALRHDVFEERYESSCQDGQGVACLKLASIRGFDYGDQCRIPEGSLANEEEFASSCADGDAEACWLRGVSLLNSNEDTSALRASRRLEPSDNSGEQDIESIIAEFEAGEPKGCVRGDAEQCINQGHLLRHFDEPEQASEYFEAACDLDSTEGCHILALELVESHNEDHRQHGLELLEDACDANRIPACLELADILLEEDDPEHDVVFDLMTRGCEEDDTRGCWPLAQYFDRRSDELHDQSCALHFSFQECTLENWGGCHTFDVD